jgi:hypothetical protein
MPRKKPQPKKPAFYKRLIMLSEDTRKQLEVLAQECSDRIGTTISQSAVLRGLVRASRQQDVGALVEAVEAELAAGTLWGSRPKKRGTRTQ